ncbi:aspartyl-tRNA(Asn)/glutamyl-tRNA(Gln) amidotransferase subunit A [Noviherbaspirillum humi]|uniref:Aspartyl-tRNA(Asn)/glutamyl-tRNA(Gln) amidotransferase subunit A n=1 Tax=Noviherbaspirillum humi TaxID=1688639 RepID=A0A239G3D4_9BURK|nr:amidase [Noviherbaspirillum humi]SNS62963.1 aspartyl-tRNA(Asn)/glutamyl-tRNA(Gln) amidotransferase subunit A [Noviherbaspirillum humi]
MNPPISQSIAHLAQLSRRELVERCLADAGKAQSVFTRLYPEAARAAADQADAMRAARVETHALAGLPVSIKDLFDVAGETTLAGSIVLKDAPPAAADAEAVRRLRRAGAAIIGKTNMTEFAFSGVGLNPHYGTPANPRDAAVARIPGGSSSGAAVSVAAGLCVAGLGSDTGGSIRIPAALCGLVGFKPTKRRVSDAGALPLSTTLDTVCAMTRSVQDCLLVDGVIADQPLSPPALSVNRLRFAVPQSVVLDGMDEQVAASFQRALSRLSAAGAEIVDMPLTPLREAPEINRFSGPESLAWHRHLLAEHEAMYDARVAKRIKLGATLSAADYVDLHRRRADWIRRMEAELAGFDAMLMPTVPTVAPPIAELEASEDEFFRVNGLMLRNPSTINLLDGCAVSLPCHAPGDLPAGLMIAGPAMSDARVMGVALSVERLLAGN